MERLPILSSKTSGYANPTLTIYNRCGDTHCGNSLLDLKHLSLFLHLTAVLQHFCLSDIFDYSQLLSLFSSSSKPTVCHSVIAIERILFRFWSPLSRSLALIFIGAACRHQRSHMSLSRTLYYSTLQELVNIATKTSRPRSSRLPCQILHRPRLGADNYRLSPFVVCPVSFTASVDAPCACDFANIVKKKIMSKESECTVNVLLNANVMKILIIH